MKVINIVGSLGIGGVQIYLLHLSKLDNKNGINREILTLYNNNGLLQKRFWDNGVKINYCPVIPIDQGWRPYSLWKKIRKFGSLIFPFKLFLELKRISPDIIIIDEPVKLITQLWVARLLNIPVIWVIHAERSLIRGKNIFKWSYKFFLKDNLRIISDSKYVLKKNIGYLKNDKSINFDKIPIVHATSDLTKFLSINIQYSAKTDSFKNPYIQFGTIGRLNWAKGFDRLIYALSKLKNRVPNFHLKIAGDGPYKNILENMIDENNLRPNIKILGELDYNEIPKFLGGLNIYVQPSVSEGSPITLKEAMASGLPILASDAGGIPEIIEHNVTGLIFKKDNIEDLEIGLLNILNLNYEQRKEIGCMAREKAKKMFDIEKTSKKLLSIYNTTIEKR